MSSKTVARYQLALQSSQQHLPAKLWGIAQEIATLEKKLAFLQSHPEKLAEFSSHIHQQLCTLNRHLPAIPNESEVQFCDCDWYEI